MQCDECLNETYYFLRDHNCLEKSYCKYNHYYDLNFDLLCLNRSNYCPDIKPYELKSTKECIETCELNDFNIKCNPTNNKISINNTYNILFNNIDRLNLEHKLFNVKEKYIISGNNISFIFTTNEIEKNEIYKYNNLSSILLNECENTLRRKYSINVGIPLIIFKIENMDNHLDYINVYYEVVNPLNLSQKLNLTECKNDLIEIRLPIKMKEYHLKLIQYTKEKGYNIFDLQDSFYNDICSIFSYNNSDISLSERKKLLDLSHENFCIENCVFSTIDINTLKSICYCKSDNYNFSLIKENGNDLNISQDSTIDFSKSSNIEVIKCFSLIFNVNIIKNNYGFYLMLFSNVINIILLIVTQWKIKENFDYDCNKILFQIKTVYKDDEKINVININKKKKYKKKIKKIKIKILKKKRERDSNKVTIIENNKYQDDENGSRNIINKNYSDIPREKMETEGEKKEEINIKKLETQKDNLFYSKFLIKNIAYEERKKYLSNNEINNLPYKYAFID